MPCNVETMLVIPLALAKVFLIIIFRHKNFLILNKFILEKIRFVDEEKLLQVI